MVVEHEEEIIRAADEIIDIGPLPDGWAVRSFFRAPCSNLIRKSKGLTAKYLRGEMKIEVPAFRRKWNNYIEITGARENNLKNIHVKIPLNIMTVITGVSGSGKSSLVKGILFPA